MQRLCATACVAVTVDVCGQSLTFGPRTIVT
jgi:hypothetical protein